MAIVSDRKMIYERKIAELQTQLTEVSGSKRAASSTDMMENNVFFHSVAVRLKMWNASVVSFQNGDYNYIVVE